MWQACVSFRAVCSSWIDYQNMPEDEERKHIANAVAMHTKATGTRPLGLYQGKPNVRTRRLLIEEGGFLCVHRCRCRLPWTGLQCGDWLLLLVCSSRYDSDAYNDDLPYYDYNYGKPHLIVPFVCLWVLCDRTMSLCSLTHTLRLLLFQLHAGRERHELCHWLRIFVWRAVF